MLRSTPTRGVVWKRWREFYAAMISNFSVTRATLRNLELIYLRFGKYLQIGRNGRVVFAHTDDGKNA